MWPGWWRGCVSGRGDGWVSCLGGRAVVEGLSGEGPGGLDVVSSAGLVAGVEAVLGQSSGWESPLGWAVARAVVRAVETCRWTSPSLELEEVVPAVLSVVLVESRDLLAWGAAHPGRDVWGWVMCRALRQVRADRALERLGGLCGDSNVFRLAWRARPVVPVEEAVLEALEAGAGQGVVGAGWCGAVGVEDLGPRLWAVVELIVAVGVVREVAVAGTCRVLELAVDGERDRRHTRARADAGCQGGVLAGLGVGPAAAGAWMSVVSGSRRLGASSAVVLALAEGRGLTAAQESWLVEILLGAPCVSGALPAPAVPVA